MLLCSGREPLLRHVAACILHYDSLCRGEKKVDSVIASLNSRDIASPIELNIANKYYTAVVDMWLHDPTGPSKRPGATTEGCIAVLSADAAIDDHVHALGEIAADQDISLRLAVAVKGTSGAERVDEWRARRVEWCLDSGFEYIEIDFSEIAEGWESREKDGLPRLIEALEMNMWSSMQRRAPKVAEKKSIEAERSESSYSPPEPVVAPTDISATEFIKSPGADNTGGDNTSTAEGLSPAATLKSASLSLAPTDEDEDRDDQVWNVFSKFIDEARTIRDNAQTGELSDDERRKRAADMACRFAEMILPGEMVSSDDES